MPTRHPRRDAQSSSGHRHLEVRAKVSAGNINLGSVGKGMAFKVIEHGVVIK